MKRTCHHTRRSPPSDPSSWTMQDWKRHLDEHFPEPSSRRMTHDEEAALHVNDHTSHQEIAKGSGKQAPDIALKECVEMLMSWLPGRYRSVIRLRYWNDLTTEQIATRLSITEATVRSHERRAVKKLRAMLEFIVRSHPIIVSMLQTRTRKRRRKPVPTKKMFSSNIREM